MLCYDLVTFLHTLRAFRTCFALFCANDIFFVILQPPTVHLALSLHLKNPKKFQYASNSNIITQFYAHLTLHVLLYCLSASCNFLFAVALLLHDPSDYYSPNATTCYFYTLSPLLYSYKRLYYVLRRFSALPHCRALRAAGCGLRVALTSRRAHPHVRAQPCLNDCSSSSVCPLLLAF